MGGVLACSTWLLLLLVVLLVMVGFYLLLVVFKRPVASSLAYVNHRKMAGVLRQSATVTAACPKHMFGGLPMAVLC